MSDTAEGFMEISFPTYFRWVWLCGVILITTSFIVLAGIHETFPGLIIAFGVALLWIALPVVVLLVQMTRKYGFRQGLKKLRQGPASQTDGIHQMPTPEDKKAFLEAAKSASMVTLDTMGAPQDLCPICLDEEDMGDPLITLRCGHVFHEKCIDSVIDTAYEKMYAPNYLGLPILPRHEVLNSLRCPLCRSQMTDLEHDIEEGSLEPIVEANDEGSVVEMAVSAVVSTPVARLPPTFYTSTGRAAEVSRMHPSLSVMQL